MTPRLSYRVRGFSLIEAMVAMTFLLVASLGLVSVQLAASRMNTTSNKVGQATALASDLAESMKRWDYLDTRLTASTTVTSVSDPDVAAKWEMGTQKTAIYTAEYSDAAADSNAALGSALGSSYQGLSTDVDRDTKTDFIRYWNVFKIDPALSGTEDGKLVQVIVRWKQPTVGYKQVTATVFRRNPAKGM
jgi:type II secretory pathway pseudopilin PulG